LVAGVEGVVLGPEALEGEEVVMMVWTRYSSVLAAIALISAVTAHAGQSTDAAGTTILTPDEQEVFLQEARILTRSIRRLGTGVTDSRRATLTNGEITHDAHIQTVDQAMPLFEGRGATEVNFKDTYRYNIAAYRLARLIGLDNVPVSVERRVDGKVAAITWWVDDVLMDEEARLKARTVGPDAARFSQQIQILRIFDELIQNRDRNQGNVLWDANWKMWMIDHTRAFRLGRELVSPDRLQRCDQSLLDGLRALTAEAMREAMSRFLTRQEIDAVIARRDLIVEHYDALIASRGEQSVLFTLGPAADGDAD
jgi:hypothetical protein